MSKELYLPELKGARKHLRANMTEAESYLWHYIRKKQLGYKFLRQVSIGYFVVDFYCKELSLAIEVDGLVHDKVKVKERDQIRQEIIASDNVIFLRFSNKEVLENISMVLSEIQLACSKISKGKCPYASPWGSSRKAGEGVI